MKRETIRDEYCNNEILLNYIEGLQEIARTARLLLDSKVGEFPEENTYVVSRKLFLEVNELLDRYGL